MDDVGAPASDLPDDDCSETSAASFATSVDDCDDDCDGPAHMPVGDHILLADKDGTNANILCMRCARHVILMSPAATGGFISSATCTSSYLMTHMRPPD